MISKFKKREKTNFSETIFFSILIGILISGIVGFLIFQNIKINQKRAKLNSQIEILRKELQELEAKDKLLKAGISQEGDDEYIEKIAREELNYQKEGETTVGFTLPEEANSSAGGEEKEEKGFWKNLWQKFLGR